MVDGTQCRVSRKLQCKAEGIFTLGCDGPAPQDAAIGNIMGSNSANIFLGLGIPWVIASIYYKVSAVWYGIKHPYEGTWS